MPSRIRVLLLFIVLSVVSLRPPLVSAQSFTLKNNATLSVESFLTISANVTTESSTTLSMGGARPLDVDGTFTYSGTVSLSTTSGGGLTLAGDLVNNGGALLTNGRTVVLDGSAVQRVGGDPITMSGLTVANASGVVLSGSVDVTGTLTLTRGPLTPNGFLTLSSRSETDAAAIAGSGGGSVSGPVTFERMLTKTDGAAHFRMLSTTTTTTLDDEGSGSNAGSLLSNVWTQAVGTGADARVGAGNASVYTYDEGADLDDSSPDLSSGWTDVPNLDNPVRPGEGYLAYLFADRDPGDGTTEGFPTTLTAAGPVQAAENDGTAVSPPLSYTTNDSEAEDGWNLIANPFMAPIDWESIENDGADLTNVDKTIYVWDAENGQYATYTADGLPGGSRTQNQFIAPFQAFFVKANGPNPSIGGIDATDKAIGQTPEVKTNPPENRRPSIALALRTKDGSQSETTALRYGKDADPGKDPYDAYQLKPLGGDYALAATAMAGTDALFDHQSRPVPAARDTVDLAVEITESGTYRLGVDSMANLPSGWTVILENVASGARYDLSAGEIVSFEVDGSASTSKSSSIKNLLHDGAPTVAKAEEGGDTPSFRLLVGPEAALPVEWTQFDATADGQEVTLSWKTASEANNAGFAVQRKGESEREGEEAWTEIGFVKGAGTTSDPRRYHFVDADLPFAAEQFTYRLRQENLDGSTVLSDEITVTLGVPTRTQLHAPFPNPPGQQATLRYEIPDAQEVEIGLYDVLGRRVRTIASGRVPAGRHEASVRTAGLAPGTYFIRLHTGTQAHTRKLTVVR